MPIILARQEAEAGGLQSKASLAKHEGALVAPLSVENQAEKQ
jgi:hypothetical protein